jgi:integrase/recombinase XerD
MTPIAPHMSAFLRERLPLQRGASDHTCDSYAYAFQLLCQFASERFQIPPSALVVEQLDAPLIMEFLHSLETARHNSPRTRNAVLYLQRADNYARPLPSRPRRVQQPIISP